MQEFISFLEQLDEVEQASHPKDREHRTATAFKRILKLVNLPEHKLAKSRNSLFLSGGKQQLEAYVPVYGEWLLEIPALLISQEKKDRKKLRRLLNDFTHLAYLSSCLDFETEEELVKRIRFAKSLKEMDDLKKGRVVQTKKIETLAERLTLARQRQKQVISDAQIALELNKRRRYLQKKKRAHVAATWLTAMISSLGVGLVSGIAMVLVMPIIFPAVSIGGLIGGLIAFTFFGSFTEFFVYRGYVKTFCMLFIKGFFDRINQHIYKREASKYLLKQLDARTDISFNEANKVKKELKYATSDDLTKQDKKQLRKQFRRERIIKGMLICCCIPIAIAAGIGFMGLVFSQIVLVLPLLGVMSGGAFIAIPFIMVTGPLFAIVMYGMMYKAVKNNIFAQMAQHIKKTFLYKAPKDQPELTFGKLKWTLKLAHIAKCGIKVFGVLFVLGISFLATAFTAQAWMESSVNFFALLGKSIAEYVGKAVGLIFLGVTYCFSVEKGLQTVASLFVPFVKAGETIRDAMREMKKHPKQFFATMLSNAWQGIKNIFLHPLDTLKALVKTLIKSFFLVHIVGSSAVTSQGAEAFALTRWFGTQPLTNKMIAGGTELLEEGMVDGYDVALHDLVHKQHAHLSFPHFQHYHHKHHHGHEHGNLWKFGVSGVRCLQSGVETFLTKIGLFAPAKMQKIQLVTPFETNAMRMRARA
jgi:hypothetical protein